MRNELKRLVRLSCPPKLRTMREFAESEIIVPDGPKAKRKYRCENQPYSKLFFDAVDSGKWNRVLVTGPVQSGKTLTTWVIPILYHLFEIGETVIVGVPTGDMVKDKWNLDLKPVIEVSRYREFLPTKGAGSQTGTPSLIRFTNGAALRFMTGGGGDKQRSAFTSRVVALTEVDGFDKSSETSREADQFTQLESRSEAYDNRKMIYGECTVSTDKGRIWQEYTGGTESRILLNCPHCSGWVQPEREHLIGWKDAETEEDAREQSFFVCPDCKHKWSNEDRISANLNSRLIHKGQELTPEGEIVGELLRTRTLGFRWSAVNNLLKEPGSFGAKEWHASRAENEDNAEKEMRQFVWCLPYEPPIEEAVDLTWDRIVSRTATTGRGVVPADHKYFTIGYDVGKYVSWFTIISWNEQRRGVVIDCGALEQPVRDMPIDLAIEHTLNQFIDDFTDQYGDPMAMWIDASYETEVIYRVARLHGHWCEAVMGQGESQRSGKYTAQKKRSKDTPWIGIETHGSYLPTKRLILVLINSDYWKTETHKLLACPADSQRALILFNGDRTDHIQFAKHITAEKKVEEYSAEKKRTITRWEQVQRQNHLLDTTYYAVAAEDALYSRGRFNQQKPKTDQVEQDSTANLPWSRWTR